MLKEVVLCADDFGLTEGVSRGILDLAQAGRISATSAMTNGGWWPALAPELGRLGPGVGVGLHLTLTAGAPLGPMPLLAPNGLFPSFTDLLLRALTGRLPQDEIRAETERQWLAFERALGRSPDFVDGHQHVHVLPGVRAPLLALLRERAAASWLRDPSDAIPAIIQRGGAAPKALIVRSLALGLRGAARAAGLATNQGFSGFSDFDPTGEVAPMFRAAFAHLGPSPVVMCHPGHVDDELARLDPVVASRPRELAYLASAGFADLLAERGLRLTPRPA